MIPHQQAAPKLEVLHPDSFAQERTKYLGGTDAAAVCGLSKRKTILELWLEKTGRVIPKDISKEWFIRLGKLYEDDVCQLFMEETGKKVRRVNETLFHPKYPFIAANVDRLVIGEDAILEAKTCSDFMAWEWEGEEIPADYIFQCYQYLLVTGKAKCYLAVAVGKTDFIRKEIYRDETVLQLLLQKEVDFWTNFVEKDVQPDVVTYRDDAAILTLYPHANEEKEIQLGDDANKLVENIKAFEADKKNLEHMIDQNKNELKIMLGDATSGTTGINRVRWINSTQSGFDRTGLKTKYPSIYDEFHRTNPTRRFSCGPIKINTKEK